MCHATPHYVRRLATAHSRLKIQLSTSTGHPNRLLSPRQIAAAAAFDDTAYSAPLYIASANTAHPVRKTLTSSLTRLCSSSRPNFPVVNPSLVSCSLSPIHSYLARQQCRAAPITTTPHLPTYLSTTLCFRSRCFPTLSHPTPPWPHARSSARSIACLLAYCTPPRRI